MSELVLSNDLRDEFVTQSELSRTTASKIHIIHIDTTGVDPQGELDLSALNKVINSESDLKWVYDSLAEGQEIDIVFRLAFSTGDFFDVKATAIAEESEVTMLLADLPLFGATLNFSLMLQSDGSYSLSISDLSPIIGLRAVDKNQPCGDAKVEKGYINITNGKGIKVVGVYNGSEGPWDQAISISADTDVLATKEEVNDRFTRLDPPNCYDFVDMGEAGIWAVYPVGVTSWETCHEDTLYFEYSGDKGHKLSDVQSGSAIFNGGDLITDTARTNMGGIWGTPTKENAQKLIDLCDIEWVTDYNEVPGLNGVIFKLKTDETKLLFIPASGYCDAHAINDDGTYGYYWLSTLDEQDPFVGYYLDINSQGVGIKNCYDNHTGYCVLGFLGYENPGKYITKNELQENYATKEDLKDKANKTDIEYIEKEYAKKTELNTVTSEFKLFGVTIEGTVSIKLVDGSETLYDNTFTDCTVDIALSNRITKFNQIVVTGDGKITKCKCPLVVDANPAWILNVSHWQDTTIDISKAYPKSVSGDAVFTQQGCKLINLGNNRNTSPKPCPYFEWDKTYPVKTVWNTVYYFEPESTFDWKKWIKEEYNVFASKNGVSPYIHGFVGTRIFDDDQEFSDAQIRALEHAVDLKGEPLKYLNCANYNMLQRLGWCDGTNATNIDLSIPSLQQVCIRNLNSNLNLTTAHIDDDSIGFLGRLAKTVSNKTVTLSGYNYYRLTDAQRSLFTSKGFNVAVNWDNDEVYKLLYDMKASGTLSVMSLKSGAVRTNTVNATTDEGSGLIEMVADEGCWLTEAADVEYRTFANSVITSHPETWKQVDNAVKVEYDNERKQELLNNIVKIGAKSC